MTDPTDNAQPVANGGHHTPLARDLEVDPDQFRDSGSVWMNPLFTLEQRFEAARGAINFRTKTADHQRKRAEAAEAKLKALLETAKPIWLFTSPEKTWLETNEKVVAAYQAALDTGEFEKGEFSIEPRQYVLLPVEAPELPMEKSAVPA